LPAAVGFGAGLARPVPACAGTAAAIAVAIGSATTARQTHLT
jgi:hypothetical protein